MWESVRSNSGIMVLLQLMNVKTPITDADCIRTLACKALAGLARSDTVRQIVSKLPMFTNGQLQSELFIIWFCWSCLTFVIADLMRDPILQEKRQEHVTFQKYALELLERLSGKTKQAGHDLEVSLINIHRVNYNFYSKIFCCQLAFFNVLFFNIYSEMLIVYWMLCMVLLLPFIYLF